MGLAGFVPIPAFAHYPANDLFIQDYRVISAYLAVKILGFGVVSNRLRRGTIVNALDDVGVKSLALA